MSKIEVSCRQIEIIKTLLYHHVDEMVDWCRFFSDDEEHLNDVLDDINECNEVLHSLCDAELDFYKDAYFPLSEVKQ